MTNLRVRVLPRIPPRELALRVTATAIEDRIGTSGDWEELIPLSDISATVAIGTVTTLGPDEAATVVNSGTSQNVILDIGIPAGSDGLVQTVVAGDGIAIDAADPNNPVISAPDAPKFVTTTTLTVGSGGTYATINAALLAASKLRAAYTAGGLAITIRLLTGFVMTEQVALVDQDLSYITITSVDASVAITASALTTAFPFTVSDNFTAYAAFSGIRSTLPTISCLFSMTGVGVGIGAGCIGVLLHSNSLLTVIQACGIKNAYTNAMLFGSKLVAPSTVWSGGYRGGVSLYDRSDAALCPSGVTVEAQPTRGFTSDLTNCSGDALLVKEASVCDARGINASGCTGAAIHARRGSIINATQSIVDGATEAGFRCDRVSTIYASNSQAIGCAVAVMSYRGSTVDVEGAVLASATTYAIDAWQNGNVNAGPTSAIVAAFACTMPLASPGVVTKAAHGLVVGDPVKFTTTGTLPTGIVSGTQYYIRTTPSLDTFTVAAKPNGTAINFTVAQSGTHTCTPQTRFCECNDAGTYGVFCHEGSTVNFEGGLASNAGSHGVYAIDGSTINALNVVANSCGGDGFRAEAASTVNAMSTSATGCTTGMEARLASTINANGATVTGYTTFGILSYEGSNIDARGISARKSGSDTVTDIVVQRGGRINVNNSFTGGLSQQPNKLLSAGIVHSTSTGIRNVASNSTINIEDRFVTVSNAAGATTLTLPDPTVYPEHEINVRTTEAQTVISASSNVVAITALSTASTAILPATDGAWALLKSDGTSYIVHQKG